MRQVPDSEPALNEVTVTVCDACLDGLGNECHTPGCIFIWGDVPSRNDRDATLRQRIGTPPESLGIIRKLGGGQ